MSNFNVRLIENRNEWEEFVRSQSKANFLQSWDWGKFHKNLVRNASVPKR